MSCFTFTVTFNDISLILGLSHLSILHRPRDFGSSELLVAKPASAVRSRAQDFWKFTVGRTNPACVGNASMQACDVFRCFQSNMSGFSQLDCRATSDVCSVFGGRKEPWLSRCSMYCTFFSGPGQPGMSPSTTSAVET